MLFMRHITLIILIVSLSVSAHSQDNGAVKPDTEYTSAAEEYSYFYGDEENIIYSASKAEEKSFDSPISSAVITREEIINAGITAIPEALRLAPGMFVYEQTNGNYDAHIRGLNMLPPNTTFMEAPNTITLVMIDGRPIFNYFSGGTIWETLPVGINDIERIEIVRGASSALYGPNAASGVINIITRKIKDKGPYISADYQGGNHLTHSAGASAGYNFGDLSVIASGNYQRRNRFNNTYYSFANNKYYSDPGDLLQVVGGMTLSSINENNDIDELYPDRDLSLDMKGGNIFASYDPGRNISIDLSGGYQSSTAQASLIENGSTSLSFRKSDTCYTHVAAEIFDFTGQFSYLGGKLDTLVGYENNAWAFDMDSREGSLEYNYRWKSLVLRPGISFRAVTYKSDYINGKHTLTDRALSFRAEYTMFDRWRIIAAARDDMYNHPDDPYYSYQFLSTYKINEDNIIRASHSRAHSETFFSRAYTDYVVMDNFLHLQGNPELKLTTIETSEAGYRLKLFKNTEIDLEAFYNTADNLARSIAYNDPEGNYNLIIKYKNVSTRAEQTGGTLSIGTSLGKIGLKIFGTVQRTKISHYLDLSGNDTGDLDDYRSTPAFYGGLYINYQPVRKLNVNLNAYYLDKYIFDYKEIPGVYDGNVEIPRSLVLNTKVSYSIWDNSSVFINCRNIMNQNRRQFVGGDRIDLLVLGGASVEL